MILQKKLFQLDFIKTLSRIIVLFIYFSIAVGIFTQVERVTGFLLGHYFSKLMCSKISQTYEYNLTII